MNRGGVLTRALLFAASSPAIWPLALATFLLRGGIVILALPILVLPTPAGLANVFAPTLTALAFGSISAEVYVFGGVATASLVVWLVVGGWVAAVLEAEGARIVGLDEGIHAPRPRPLARSHVAGRILAARLVALVPLAIALALGSVRIVLVTYRELTNPLDVSTPLVMRVLRESPEVVAAVIVTWILGETVGGIAARRIVLAGNGVAAALRFAIATGIRHPGSTLARFGLPAMVLLVVLLSSIVAAGSAWSAVGGVLVSGSDPRAGLAIVALLVVVWLAGLLVTGLVCAWRAAIWTVAEIAREGTFGGSADRRPGDWQTDRTSATL
ncbi:MAG TPA: hypothetical protein VIL81_05750 [Candidatus Limnocylindrales bacterium]